MLVEDANKKQIVATFMSGLQSLAEHYHIAIILSVGAPKSNKQNAPTTRRDMVFGAEQWSRSADTVAVLTVDGDGTNSLRKLSVQHRNEAAEHFDLEFKHGLLSEVQLGADTADPLWDLIAQQPGEFTSSELLKVAKEQLGYAKSSFHTRINKYIADGKLAQRVDRKTRYLKAVGVKL
jgi:hypothetical protein